MPLLPPLSSALLPVIPKGHILIVMAVAVPEFVYSYSKDFSDIDDEFELDVDTTSKFLTFQPRKSSERERQISVDPMSLKESSMRNTSFNMILPPINTPQNIDFPIPPPLPAKFKFLSNSVPHSAMSSPRKSSFLPKKNGKNEIPHQLEAVERSDVTLSQESILDKSKSCGDGRKHVPFDELDLVKARNTMETGKKQRSKFTNAVNADHKSHKSANHHKNREEEDSFKCGAMCMFMPTFGKGKPVRPRKDDVADNMSVISRTVSLEKFECGSWASSAIVPDQDEDTNHLYFDLPLELISTTVNDSNLPVNSAFVFDKKGVLRNGTTGRKSHESARHVRLSVSSSPASACITPRLLKAREDFNTFLEAHST
ncbi:hypothetical protein ACFE04_030503 [Oxalis oulophora]